VEAGSRLVADAGRTMGEIVGSVQRVSSMINEITVASSEQTDGIMQISTAVDQLDEMTQQNAALVEQGSAAAESLKSQATRLAEVVGAFRLEKVIGDDGAEYPEAGQAYQADGDSEADGQYDEDDESFSSSADEWDEPELAEEKY
jgi:uncharacterized phage infection (PIP) family protein YhgE